jgi:light-regulated signal transduction histidine kinase (bacteriophytochrome)
MQVGSTVGVCQTGTEMNAIPRPESAARPHGTSEQEEIENLRAENLASHAENVELRETARADRLRIENLKESNDSLESVIAELRRTKAQVDTLNRDLETRNHMLQTLNNELESFSYAVSHDLRTPLRSIFGFSEALRASAAEKLTEEEANWLKKVAAAATRMDRLTEDLLRLSRITRSQLKREAVDLSALARDVIHELRQNSPGRSVVAIIPEAAMVRADPTLMRVAMANLLGNAWKYTGNKAEAVIAFCEEARENGRIFSVKDNGAGFDMAYASKLFTPFQRLHSAREFPGSGVGLACVARIIHKHGGRIWADATPGQGAAFFFTVPECPGQSEGAD